MIGFRACEHSELGAGSWQLEAGSFVPVDSSGAAALNMYPGIQTMRIFLTGGTGYIGSAVLDALVRAGHRVDALVRNTEKAAQVQARGAHPVIGELGKSAELRQRRRRRRRRDPRRAGVLGARAGDRSRRARHAADAGPPAGSAS